MIISHIDSDHISGAIKFIEDNTNEEIIKIDEVWFNTYRHLQISKKDGVELQDSERAILETEVALGKSYLTRVNQDEITKEEISAKQGSTLGALLLKGKYKWNNKFDGRAITTNSNQLVTIDNIKINVLSPNEEKLIKLGGDWVKELKKKKWNFTVNENELFDDAYEFMQMMLEDEAIITVSEISKENNIKTNKLIEYIEKEYPIDESANNGSSIAILISFNNKKLLFLADAHPDIIVDNLKKLGEEKFDLVKVSHHGSLKNTSNELAKILCSNNYLFQLMAINIIIQMLKP